jgi:hypothetical protein
LATGQLLVSSVKRIANSLGRAKNLKLTRRMG